MANKQGRPKSTTELKSSRTASVTATTMSKAIQHFGSLGKAIEWAIDQYEKKNKK